MDKVTISLIILWIFNIVIWMLYVYGDTQILFINTEVSSKLLL